MIWLILAFTYLTMNVIGIYLFYKYLMNRLHDKLSIWLFSISLSLGINFLLVLAGLILLVNFNFTKNLLIPSSHV
ncbi:hypothetical protein SAMN05421813_107162 [Daejeonella rubra]|uniref:Uncharacterized protein n=1 Tax=Daejeonella rubra TaxID=990371 RepID=A0A1G9R9K5_9SPHI|nr:hypothetical protein SAMN05421813_107162 [Daejeonella rubra]